MKKQPTTARPILFSPEMVRAILEGRKTQTRRIIKLRDGSLPDDGSISTHINGSFDKVMDFSKTYPYWQELHCPYGRLGDHLWVRETWAKQLDGKYIYRANHQEWERADYTATGAWRPSIFMPLAASRILLEITDISAQRLHDITEADAIAEGINSTTPNGGPNKYYDNYHTGRWMEAEFLNNPILSYQTLWEKINGKESWQQNPWVWVITFKPITPAVVNRQS